MLAAPVTDAAGAGASSTFAQRWRRPALGALLLWFAVRVVVYVEAIIVRLIDQGPRMSADPGWFFSLFWNWDSVYFTTLADGGYFGPEAFSVWQSFFPGYPIAIRAVATPLFGLDPTEPQLLAAAWLVALVASSVAAILLWKIAHDSFGEKVALAATALFVAGPYSHFLVASYSEALFLAFALAAWYWATKANWWAAGSFAAAASLTRANGIFLIAALLVVYALARRREGKPWMSRALGLGAIGATGVGSYFLYLFVTTGDLFAWSHAQQAGWGRITQWPWYTMRNSIIQVVTVDNPLMYRIQYVFDIAFALGLIVIFFVLIRKRWWPAAVLVFLTGASMMTSYNYVSLARNTLTLFPIAILFATVFLGERFRWIYWVAFGLGFALLLFNVRQFALGLWSD